MKNMKNMKRNKSRFGFSMVELVFVIIIIGILGVVVTNIVSPSVDSIQIEESAKNDIEAVSLALVKYRANKSSANNTFAGVNAETLNPYISANMVLTGTGATSYFSSMYFEDSLKIYVASDTDSDAGNRRAKILIDASGARFNNEWGVKGSILYQDLVEKTLKNKQKGTTVVQTASAIADDMSANIAGVAGTNDDAIIGFGNFR